MKNTRTIKINDAFLVKIICRNTGDNYTQFAHIMYKGDKTPHFGTCFKETASDEEIKDWANERIYASHNDDLLKQLTQ